MTSAKQIDIESVGSYLRSVLGTKSPAPAAQPKGLPKMPTNADESVNDRGIDRDYGLTDPGIVNPVTGSGHGLLLVRR